MIRHATPADASAVADLWNPIIRDTVITFNPVEKTVADIEDMIRSRQAGGHAFMVAESGGRLTGFGTYAQFRTGLGYARSMEHSINLSPDARGQGTGSALMQALEDHATAAGVHCLVGGITATNEGSIRFHARRGYREVGRMPEAGWKFGRYHDLVLMQKILG